MSPEGARLCVSSGAHITADCLSLAPVHFVHRLLQSFGQLLIVNRPRTLDAQARLLDEVDARGVRGHVDRLARLDRDLHRHAHVRGAFIERHLSSADLLVHPVGHFLTGHAGEVSRPRGRRLTSCRRQRGRKRAGTGAGRGGGLCSESAVKGAGFGADLHRTRLFSRFGRRKRGQTPLIFLTESNPIKTLWSVPYFFD